MNGKRLPRCFRTSGTLEEGGVLLAADEFELLHAAPVDRLAYVDISCNIAELNLGSFWQGLVSPKIARIILILCNKGLLFHDTVISSSAREPLVGWSDAQAQQQHT